MRARRSLVMLFSAVACVAALPGPGRAQTDSRPVPSVPDPRTDSRAVPARPDPRTDSPPVQSAPDPRTDSTATPPQGRPDLRTDSKPRADASPETDSKPYDLGADYPAFLDLGFDPNTVAPAGTVATSAPGNPLLLYLALEQRSSERMAPTDAALIQSRQSDLNQAARRRGYDLMQTGWVYHQVLCPAADGAPGALVLHFMRGASGSDESLFTAIVPRDGGEVRVIAVVHHKRLPSRETLRGKRNAAAVDEAISPTALFSQMEPRADWLATGACIAEVAGAVPHIPNDPDLDGENRILAAPSPLLRLLLNGDRKVYFTDREDPDHYSIWDEWVEHSRRADAVHSREIHFKEARHQRYDSPVLAVTNPPVTSPQPPVMPPEPPLAHLTPAEPPVHSGTPAEPPVLPVTQPPAPASVALNPPRPPVVMMPLPPGPLSGEQQ